MNRKELLLLSIGIFLTVIAWLVADIYHATTREKIKTKVELPSLSNYEIDPKILDILEKKMQ